FRLVFSNTYVKNADIGETCVNNTDLGRIFVPNLGCDVRGRLQPGPSWRWVHAVPSRGGRLFHRCQERRRAAAQVDRSFRASRYGSSTGGLRPREFRTSPSVDRFGTAAAGSTDSERLHAPAFWRRPD